MPYLQLDVSGPYPTDVKRELARRLAGLYARFMRTTPDRVSVAFRELGEGNLWGNLDGDPEPVAVLMCEVRDGRHADRRLELADALSAACVTTLGLRADRFVIEFTQHAADEMYRPGRGWAAPWSSAEADG